MLKRIAEKARILSVSLGGIKAVRVAFGEGDDAHETTGGGRKVFGSGRF